jgi:hypothetical protein
LGWGTRGAQRRGEVRHSPSNQLHTGGSVVDGDRWGGCCPVVVVIGGSVMELAGAQAKLDGSEVRLDDGWCGSVTGRCSRWMWKMWGACFGMCPSRCLGLGSEPESMSCHVAPGWLLTRFPWWLKSVATSEHRCRVEQSVGGRCEMVKQIGRRSPALLRLVVGDKGKGARTRAVSET